MAFPFQYGSTTDPVIAACKDTEFMIYCNTIVPASQRFRFWYQYANLGFAGILISLPLTLLLLTCITTWWRTRRKHYKPVAIDYGLLRRTSSVFSRVQSSSLKAEIEDTQDLVTALPSLSCSSEALQSDALATKRSSRSGWRQSRILASNRQLSWPNHETRSQTPSIFREDFRRSVRSFALFSEDNSAADLTSTQVYDLGIIPLLYDTPDHSSYRIGPSRCPSPSPSGRESPGPKPSIQPHLGPGVHTVGLVDLEDLELSALLDLGLEAAVRQLDILRVGKGCTGIVIRINDASNESLVATLLQTCFEWAIEVIIMCNADAKIWSTVDFDQIAGIIIENGCILPNGHRRDFFRSTHVRQLMGKCAGKRNDRPAFFAGFYDLWHTQPSASVVRRAFKLAEFYGATLEHAPLADAYGMNNRRRKLPPSLGAFDYLKRSETVEVCIIQVGSSSHTNFF
jgi:hypothetical protein